MCFFVQTNHTRKELLFLMFKEINLRNHSSLHKLFYGLEIEWLNINDSIRHLKNDNYVVKLNENGRINIWTNLEYAQYRHDQQEKK